MPKQLNLSAGAKLFRRVSLLSCHLYLGLPQTESRDKIYVLVGICSDVHGIAILKAGHVKVGSRL
jgi:hypothetical protein